MDSSINKAEIMLDAIFRVMQNRSFSLNEASHIVGGEARLKRLIAEGKIEATKPDRKWFCNAAQVLRYAKPRTSQTKNK